MIGTRWICGALFLAATPTATFADEAAAPTGGGGFYAETGYTLLDVNIDNNVIILNGNLSAITGRFGYGFTENFAVEGEASIGVSDSDDVFAGLAAALEVNTLYAVYARGRLPLSDYMSAHARIGFAGADVDAKLGNRKVDIDGDIGFAGGVGGTASLNKYIYARFDYTRYEVDDLSSNTFGFSLGGQF